MIQQRKYPLTSDSLGNRRKERSPEPIPWAGLPGSNTGSQKENKCEIKEDGIILGPSDSFLTPEKENIFFSYKKEKAAFFLII